MATRGWVLLAIVVGVGGIVWGAETFAEHLAPAAVALGVSSFALAMLLAGAEPEELATGIVGSPRVHQSLPSETWPAPTWPRALQRFQTVRVVCLIAMGRSSQVSPHKTISQSPQLPSRMPDSRAKERRRITD
jgi:hypothetical protein